MPDLYSLGIINKIGDAFNIVSIAKEYKPIELNRKVYEDIFKIFHDLYESLKQYF